MNDWSCCVFRMNESYVVQYTHQKLKKHKTWQDGMLIVRVGERFASLRDDAGKSIDSVCIPSGFTFETDAELETERYRLLLL